MSNDHDMSNSHEKLFYQIKKVILYMNSNKQDDQDKTINKKTNKKINKTVRGNVPVNILVAIIYIVSLFFFVVCYWSKKAFNVQFNDIVITLTSPIEGAGDAVFAKAFSYCLPRIFLGLAVPAVIQVAFVLIKKKFGTGHDDNISENSAMKRLKITRRILWSLSPILLALTVLYINKCYRITDYIIARNSDSSLYEQNYVNPHSVSISPEGATKNLIYIYLESMENTYASVEDGGSHDVNYIPNLTRLANENVSFSQKDKLGGFYANYGATWTLGAMYTTMSGVPYNLPLEGNTPPDNGEFASGLITIGQVLKEKGYHNEFLCGSDAKFAGRKLFLNKHGKYEIYDYYKAIKNGVIDKGYKHWWGFEDFILYRIAKDELTRLYEEGEPFNLTMLTVDTHYPDGYVCELCEDIYPNMTGNVVLCADKQINEFIEWCKEQPFYKDTVIVITGDHPRMDTQLVDGIDPVNRTVYNCIINGIDVDHDITRNRLFESYDIFPTTLAAMGYTIEGNRLGIGTNMYSGNKTLLEQYGDIMYLEGELAKGSDYYVNEFAPELKSN